MVLDKKTTDKIDALKQRLDKVLILENLHSEEVLEVSRELDTLIIEIQKKQLSQ